MIIKARKKPVVIEAVQLKENDESIKECLMFCEIIDDEQIKIYSQTLKWFINYTYKNKGIDISTLEGKHHVSFGDYIIKGVKGELYPCKPDIFEKTYELV